MKKRFFYLFVLLYCLSFSLNAQNQLRKEIIAPIGVKLFRMHNCQENGVLLFFPSPKFDLQKRQYWKFYLIDTAFNNKIEKQFALPPGLDFISAMQEDHYTNIVFKRIGKSENVFFILRLNDKNGEIDSLRFRGPKKSKLNHFCSRGKQGILAIQNLSNYDDCLYYDIERQFVQKIEQPTAYTNIRIGGICKHDKQIGFHVLVQDYTKKKWYANYIWGIDSLGNIQQDIFLEDPVNPIHFPHQFKLISDPEKGFFVTGLYSKTRAKARNIKKLDQLDIDGCFFYHIDDEKQKSRFYSFTPPNSRKKKKKKKQRSSEKLQYLYNKSYIKDDHIYLFTESYFPQYRTVTRMDYDFYGRLEPRTEKIFEGYRFIEGQKWVLDLNGQLEYSAKVDLFNILEKELNKHLCHLDLGKEQVMAYMNHSSVASSIFEQAQVSYPIEYDPIHTGHSDDQIISDDQLKIEHWYGNFFLTYGYQDIKNSSKSALQRHVFFISKLEFK